ncbi:MAG: alpha/beta fold hydrolase [Undibacterium sp.]|uniref:S9 family peptidase n=1 Tax=Undibacterium sp. TaxID=1914977 RepID=UPI0027286E0E|nr:alpha/beta fold hydrolase [Undibacterium sp.]MDO8652256.1 alpha/beta fold hydrolase [Undibacterium sp.]
MQHSFTSICKRFAVCIFSAASLVLVASAQTPTERLPIESFFKNSQIGNVQFSPDGKSIAMLAAGNNDRLVLAVMDTDSLTPRVLAKYEKTDIVFFDWVNNQRLVYGIGDRQIGDGDRFTGSGLFAINKDGSQQRQLIETYAGIAGNGTKFRVLNARHGFLSVSNIENSDEIFVTRSAGTRKNPSATLIKLNTINGYNEIVPAPTNSIDFMIDKAGQLRIAITSENQYTGVHYLDEKTKQWRKLIEYDNVKEEGFSPEFIAPDGQLYVTAHHGQDTTSVYLYDLEKNKIDDAPLVSTKGFDFEGNFLFSKKQNKLLGIRFESDAMGTLWLDDTWKKWQKKIDDALPNTVNLLTGAINSERKTILVTSSSDTHPGSTLLFNTETEKFMPIGDRMPEINSKKMSFQDFVKIKARDGLEIPAYLTLPRNSTGKNLPMVVMVHGGPYVRGGHWGWNRETQFLASRGYAVLEPDFRGSTGYGHKLFKAGWKQWGLAMQDDITDATKWAIAQGYADPKRICIAGASYGGYATLMGLIKEPDLYQCGISWVGVTDINYLFDVSWSDTSGSTWSRYGMPAMIGDQIKDAAQLKATSPVEQAYRLNKPLILAYGAADVRVPMVHGERFIQAAKPGNAKIEWITYPEEAHGWRLLKNNVDFWSRAEKFLDQHTAIK